MNWQTYKSLDGNDTDPGGRREDDRGFVYMTRHVTWNPAKLRACAKVRGMWGDETVTETFPVANPPHPTQEELAAAMAWVDREVAENDRLRSLTQPEADTLDG